MNTALRPGLVTNVTPRNGLNIAGVDASGDIRVIWTAPGVAGWRESNLSDIAGTPTLVGPLTVYVALWGAGSTWPSRTQPATCS